MIFPIPNRLAKTAAKDIASDVRKHAAKAVLIHEAIERGEAGETDRKEYDLLMEQIRSLCGITFVCAETREEFRVADFVTRNAERKRDLRISREIAAYLRLEKLLH